MQPLPLRPRAVLFDLDGTLVDSERDAAEALDRVLRRHGRPISQAERAYVIGHGWPDIYQYLLRQAPVALALEELEHEVYLVRVEMARASGVTALPGAVALVRRVSGTLPCA